MLARSKRYIKEAILSIRYQLNQSSVVFAYGEVCFQADENYLYHALRPQGLLISGPSHLLSSNEYTAR